MPARPSGRAQIDLADPQPVGVGMRLGLEHAPTTKCSSSLHPVMVDRLDLGPGHRQALLDAVDVKRGVAVFAQPGQRNASSELLQEAQVILVVEAQVGDAVLEHRDPLDPHAPREALHLLGVVAGRVGSVVGTWE